MSAITTLIELGVFDVLAEDDGKPKKTEDIAKRVGADPNLIGMY